MIIYLLYAVSQSIHTNVKDIKINFSFNFIKNKFRSFNERIPLRKFNSGKKKF